MDLPELWRLHQNTSFPPSALSRSQDGTRLVRIDAEVGASLTASLRSDGLPRLLTPLRRSSLEKGLELVRKVLLETDLDPDARAYFARLETLSLAVLAVRA